MAQGIGMAKSKDGAITLGPALVTVDELEPYRRDGRLDLELSATVNGEELTRGTLAQMDWTFGELLAYISRGTDLPPGAVIGSGTVPGGCLLEHVDTPAMGDFKRWLRAGDVVSLSGVGLGETRQTVTRGIDVIPLRANG
jgi:2-keto-4-pentenoate hydratase/2-oxohepta-3-ene-1,7-dioic acid hydratase in catechol pathway